MMQESAPSASFRPLTIELDNVPTACKNAERLQRRGVEGVSPELTADACAQNLIVTTQNTTMLSRTEHNALNERIEGAKEFTPYHLRHILGALYAKRSHTATLMRSRGLCQQGGGW